MNLVRIAIRYGWFPVVITLNLLAFEGARRSGYDLEMTLLMVTLLTLALTTLLEHLAPHESRWNRNEGDLRTDATSFLVLGALLDPALKFLAPFALVLAYGSTGWEGQTWATFAGLPYWIQVIGALVVMEFGYYWAHRWHHAGGFPWWLHALHHSSNRLYALNTARFHPLNYVFNFFAGTFPLMLMGAPAEILLGTMAIAQPVLFLQHANIELSHGVILNRLFATNEVHRWHHSNRREEGNNNYGRALVLFDLLFGTYIAPENGRAPHFIGLFDASNYPQDNGYWRLVIARKSQPGQAETGVLACHKPS